MDMDIDGKFHIYGKPAQNVSQPKITKNLRKPLIIRAQGRSRSSMLIMQPFSH